MPYGAALHTPVMHHSCGFARLRLFTRKTKGNPEARYAAKWRLAKLLYERHWDKQQIIDLFGVIDWLMR